LVPYILKGDWEELVGYFPEVKPAVERYKSKMDEEYANLEKVWEDHWKIEGQKDFALAIKGKTRFTSLLFDMRKRFTTNQTKHDLLHLWADSAQQILKVLFPRPEVEMLLVQKQQGFVAEQ
jgi:hypothetical protein